jgi:cell wall-associated NlpC family hydrolase
MTPEFWTARLSDPDGLLADPASIAAQNERLRVLDPAVRSLESLQDTIAGEQVRAWIGALSRAPAQQLYDGHGIEVAPAELDELVHALALDAVPATQATRFGLVTHRASLRTFPTARQVFNQRGDDDLDRFQESAFFPGTPVVVVHTDRSGDWVFVVGEFYAAWMSAEAVAIGERGIVLGYGRREPALIVTGPQVRTMPSEDEPTLSELVLDMGVRVPLLQDSPADVPADYGSGADAHVIELPVRTPGGGLRIARSMLSRSSDVSAAPLEYTRGVLIRQAFKFLGERYGWGHAHGARDCSGFVSEVYRSVGIELPRNSQDQAASEAFDRLVFDANVDRAARIAVLRRLQAGDLVYTPGHVMMVLGQTREGPWVIHDTNRPSMRDADGALRPLPANGVVVTPLLPLDFGPDGGLVDAVTAVQRIHPRSAG